MSSFFAELEEGCNKELKRFRIFGKKKAYYVNTFKISTILTYKSIQVGKKLIANDKLPRDTEYISKLSNQISITKTLGILYRKHPLFHDYKAKQFDDAMVMFLSESVDYLQAVSDVIDNKSELDIRESIQTILNDTINNLIEEEEDDEEENHMPFRFKAVPAGEDFQHSVAEFTRVHARCCAKQRASVVALSMLEDVVITDITEIIAGVDLWKNYKRALRHYNTISHDSK